MIAFPDWNKTFIVTTDASILGLGAILSQKYETGERVIEYASRGLNKAECNYSVSELECLAVTWAVDKFAMYIANNKFELITDHSALKRIKTIKSNNPRLFRWSLKMSELNYDVTFRPGKDNANADILSRDIAAMVLLIDYDKIKEYVKDNGKIVNDTETGVTKFSITKGNEIWSTTLDGKLWHQVKWWDNPRLVIDNDNEKKEILSAVHANGHFGFKKCYHHLQRRYFWKGMYMDCKLYCKSCAVCQCRVALLPGQGGDLGKIVATRRGELIGIDLFSGIPESANGNVSILMISDYVTKYAMVIPIKNKKAVSMASMLYENWITKIGFPERIQSDKGKEFVAKICKKFYAVCGIKKLQTSGWHPQANGQVERLNKTLAAILAKTCAEDQRHWDEYLQTVIMEYNAMTHRVTGETPYFMMFQKDFIFPINIKKRVHEIQDKAWDNSKFPELMK